MARYTTLGIGGPADHFVSVKVEDQLKEAIRWAEAENIPWLVIGSGSNLLISGRGFPGLVIKNEVAGIRRSSRKLTVKGGTALQKLVDFANRIGLAGFENLTGIPGTVAGAIYGNAGAYGQTISDALISVTVFDGRVRRIIRRSQCRFSYRKSIFKEKRGWFIIEAEFRPGLGDPKTLRAASREVRAVRDVKYPPGLKCPGSFFKNLRAADLPAVALRQIPRDKIRHGKVPAGYLLEEVGAKGKSRGAIRITDYHGNLFFNEGGGTARDFWRLAEKYRRRVEEKFGIDLEPEVQLVGFGEH
ncbi:MAG: UDP-N-acetylmuramate dehydrogenase [Patescibacteria group bacterium]